MTPEGHRGTPFGRALLAEWSFEPGIVYLNHGTVGAPPRRVLEVQQAIRDEIERQPARFLLRGLSEIAVGAPRPGPPRMRVAAEQVARFVGARGEDLVFVDNATTGVNAVLRSFPLGPGDEILVSDHAYGAIANAASFAAREAGARVRTVVLPGPPFDEAGILEAFRLALGARTRIAIVEHVTPMSALLLPLARIAALCRERGIAVLADGAHAPGAIALDLPALGVDWYAANLHKWAFAPRSSGFLWAARERQEGLHPPVISWGLDTTWTAEFDWVGTRDPSPHLAAPAGIEFLHSFGEGAVHAYDHALAWSAGRLLTRRLGTTLPVEEEMVGTMVTVPLPPEMGRAPEDAARVRDALLFRHGIEVQVHAFQDRLWTRVSAQIYNDHHDVERLADAVLALREEERSHAEP